MQPHSVPPPPPYREQGLFRRDLSGLHVVSLLGSLGWGYYCLDSLIYAASAIQHGFSLVGLIFCCWWFCWSMTIRR